MTDQATPENPPSNPNTSPTDLDQALEQAQQKKLIQQKDFQAIFSTPSPDTPQTPHHPQYQTFRGLFVTLIIVLVLAGLAFAIQFLF